MLCQLSINNFAIVRFLELDFQSGMTCITGETGAGKSIAIDALGLCLGNRADVGNIRAGASKTEISAIFSLDDVPDAKQWLLDNDLSQDNECILRRTINHDGRSRAYINGNPVPVTQLKALGQLLISIHGQHAHHAMLKPEQQLRLIDDYAAHDQLIESVKHSYQTYKKVALTLSQLQQNIEQSTARKQLLEYQIDELNQFALKEGEFAEIEQEHKRLANSSTLIETCQNGLNLLNEADDANIASMLNKVINLTAELTCYDSSFEPVNNMLNEALITVQESSSEIAHYLSHLEVDPQHFIELESRISQAMQLARKHQVSPQELALHHKNLQQELGSLGDEHEQLEQLKNELESAKENYFKNAKKLFQSRQRSATQLSKQVTSTIQQLNMPQGKFEIQINHHVENINSTGCDAVEFLVSANLGQNLQPLYKVASGGELSRIGLAIQVITAQKVAMPTLIFDEVDVGISGATAAIVGKMLRQLGDSTQVLCVTHLPQVAGNGHHHMLVNKRSNAKQTETSMVPLNQQQRIEELARLLGGNTITANTLANAKELLI